MPIIELQRRLREIGRIRIGEQVPTSNGKTRPSKLASFRFTSRDRKVIDAAAEAFGGEVAPWESPDGDQWEVKSTADEIACVVPPGDMAFSQWYELWSAGGCKRRCDGITEHITETACKCDPEARECAIHTRISLLLTDLPGLGLWRLDTSGYYAAVELGGVVDLASSFTERGQMLPARLRLEQRSVKREGPDGKVQTRRFAVPTLDLDVHPLALVRASSDAPVLGVGATTPSFTPVPTAELSPAPVGTIAEQLAEVDQPKARSTRRNAAAPLPATGLPPRTAAQVVDTTAGGERVCTRCQQRLANAVVERDGDGYAHKGTCPEPEPGDTDASGITVKQLAAAATKAFPLEDAPRGEKTKTRDRLRYALTLIVTNGEERHMDRLTLEQMVALDARLHDVADGRITYTYGTDGATFTLNDKPVTIAWADVDEPVEQQQKLESA